MNWKIGKQPSVVVSDEKIKNTNFPVPPNLPESDDREHEYYGGYLVAESIGNDDYAKLIAAAPDMLEALAAASEILKLIPPLKFEEDNDLVDGVVMDAYVKVKAAIKKATA